MNLSTIFSHLPDYLKSMLGTVEEGKWFDVLDNAQKNSPKNGEYLAVLFASMVDNNIKSNLITQPSTLLDAKIESNEISKTARDTYQTAKTALQSQSHSHVDKKRKAVDPLKKEPLIKKQAKNGMTEEDRKRSHAISESTWLLPGLSDIVSDYTVIVPFPWKDETFSGYAGTSTLTFIVEFKSNSSPN